MHEKWLCCSATDGSPGKSDRGMRMFAQFSQTGATEEPSLRCVARDSRGKAASDERFRTSSGNRLALLFSFLQLTMGRSASTLPVVVLVLRSPGGPLRSQRELIGAGLARDLGRSELQVQWKGCSSRTCLQWVMKILR